MCKMGQGLALGLNQIDAQSMLAKISRNQTLFVRRFHKLFGCVRTMPGIVSIDPMAHINVDPTCADNFCQRVDSYRIHITIVFAFHYMCPTMQTFERHLPS